MTAVSLELLSAQEYEEELEGTDPKPDSDVKILAFEASRRLGYKVLTKEVQARSKHRDKELTLLAVLREHGVGMYRPEDIEAYKTYKEKRFRRLAKIMAPVTLVLAIILTLPLIAAVVDCWLSFVGNSLYWHAGLISGTLVVAVLAWTLFDYWATQDKRTTVTWPSFAIKEYTGEIPEDALALAVRLKKAVPTMEFTVQEMQVERVAYDPLLFAKLDGVCFCIAVWDEPGFTAELVG